ncbi:site-specific DNA-methyltransferase [Candidatus Poriferisocius sp.]|uniref:site-specific DNA-methyltransferase n=1 Tax=Candidatus Poriferisocius sp. TaxID=3101276 RepID=UPI003B5AB162
MELVPEDLAVAMGQRAVDPQQERYGLSWPGKAAAAAAMQEPSVGSLRPDADRSLRADVARDVVVEGDSLEVLKLLQRAYYGKVKMIYIDPPYNTGKEFIYPDNFREGLATYLRFTGQSDESGKRLSANAETSGRYHSNWLSMMFPRLALARNLLRPDGAIFMTIDDHEVHNLRLLMDEIFGPENFVASCIWQKVYGPKNSARHFSEDHDYVLVYARNAAEWEPNPLPRTEKMEARYQNPDDDPRGPWKSGDLSARNYYSKGTYPIETPSGRPIPGPPPGTYWRYSEEKFKEMVEDNRIWFGADGSGTPAVKRFLSEVREGRVPQTLWKYEEVGHTDEAKKELLERVEFASSESVFNTPKPTRLIERMLRLATTPATGDIVLDFFAGSGATGEAVWKLNAEDGGNRRFVLVQLPEPTGYDDYETVAGITRARLKGAATALTADGNGTLEPPGPMGFRSFALAESNFRVWDGEADGGEALEARLSLFADGVSQSSTAEEIVAELLLKAGYELTEQVDVVEAAGVVLHSVADGQLVIVVDGKLTLEAVEEIVARRPPLILVLDRCFGDDDEMKVNAMQTIRSANQSGGADITLKVV